jgi:tetratricopeptide (TPR) repeat protein
VASLEEALWQAIATRRDDIALKCAAELEGILGYFFDRAQEGERWARFGEALLARLGPGHERSASWLHHNRGLILERRADFRGALVEYRAGLALKQQVLPPNHPDIGMSWSGISNALIAGGDHAGGLEAADNFLDNCRQAFGDDSPLLGHPLGNRGEVLALVGRNREAERDLRASIERWEAFVGPDHLWVSYPLTALGKTLLADGRAAEAIAPLERAVRIRERAEAHRDLLAESQFALARARWIAGGDHAAARTLAVAARDAYRGMPAQAKNAAEVDGWLAAHTLARK